MKQREDLTRLRIVVVDTDDRVNGVVETEAGVAIVPVSASPPAGRSETVLEDGDAGVFQYGAPSLEGRVRVGP